MPDRPETWQAAFDLIRTRGYERREEPFKLASGQLSHDYIDGKYAVDTGERLTIVSRAVADLAASTGIEYDAVGGLTMGADPLAHGIAMVTGKAWFSVRKEQKQRGREQWVEGTRLEPGTRVLLVDDVISTGGSTEIAFERIAPLGVVVTRRHPDGRPRRRRGQALRRPQRAVRRAGHLPGPGHRPGSRTSEPGTTSSFVGSTPTVTVEPGSNVRASVLGSCASTTVPSANSTYTREIGPRNATDRTVAAPAGVGGHGHRLRPQHRRARTGLDRTGQGRHRRCRAVPRGPTQPWAGTLLFRPTNSATNGVAGFGVDLGGRSELLEPALAHHADPVGDGKRLLLVVGDEQRRRTDVELHAADLVAQLGAHLGVERRQRLVEQQHAAAGSPGTGQRHPLLLTARHLDGVLVHVRRQARPGRASRPRGWRGRASPCRAS